MCVCACARMCLRAWVLERVSSECFGEQEICVDRATENGRKQSFLCFFFSLSPSLLPVGQGLNPNVSWNKTDCSFFYAWQAELSVGCFEPNFQKPRRTVFFLDAHLKTCLNQQCFEIVSIFVPKGFFAFKLWWSGFAFFFLFFFIKTLQLMSPLTPKPKFCHNLAQSSGTHCATVW